MLAHLILILTVCCLLSLAERRIPAERGQAGGGRIRNGLYILIFTVVGGLATRGLFTLIGSNNSLYESHGLVVTSIVVVATLFTTDLLFYWYHRLQHDSPLLWQLHELHHADTQLNATSSLRTYWLEHPVQAVLIGLPTSFILNLDATAAAIVPVVLTAWLFFTHANLRLSLGPLTSLLCGPQLHRIHHSRLPQHRDKNFAQFFPIIDKLFGTYYAPQRDEYPPTGTSGLAVDAPLRETMTKPFTTWAAMFANAIRRNR